MADPIVILGHYQAGYQWNISGDHVVWQAAIHKGGALVGTRGGRIHDAQGPEHITEEGVRMAVLDAVKMFAEESGDDEDDLITGFKDA